MRVALVSTPFVSVPPAAYGGTELIVYELAKGLEGRGHEVTLFATGDSEGTDVRWLWPRPIWPPDPYSELLHARFAMQEIGRGRFDVIHVHCPSALALADRAAAPVVYTIHHDFEPHLNSYYLGCGGSVRFVAISARQGSRERGIPCEVIHHGLDPGRYPLGDGAGGYALFIGRLTRCKGPDAAIEAALAAGIEIEVAGKLHPSAGDEGWSDEVLLPLLHGPNVRWAGEADQERKLRLLARARAVLAPIRWEEPFGLVMIEAMLSGCPVIAFPRGSAAEIVEEGVTGFLARDVAEMAGILRHLDGFDRSACRRRAVERWSSERMVGDYLKVYERAALVDAQEPGVGAIVGASVEHGERKGHGTP